MTPKDPADQLEPTTPDAPAPQLEPTPAPATRGAKRIRDAQTMLGVTVTGKLGRPTVDAIRAYQAAASLPVTGDLDADTWKQLHR
jgi:peptidoglycan hydrolase-like protein with peptidoglycan-binding domain